MGDPGVSQRKPFLEFWKSMASWTVHLQKWSWWVLFWNEKSEKKMKLAANASEFRTDHDIFYSHEFILGLGYSGAWEREIGNTLGGTRTAEQSPASQCLSGYCKLAIKQARLSILMSLVWWDPASVYSVRERNYLTYRGHLLSFNKKDHSFHFVDIILAVMNLSNKSQV